LLGDVGKHQQGRLHVLFIAAIGNGCSQHAIGGLCRGADITDRDLVFTRLQVSPFGRHFRAVQQLLVDDKRNGAGVGQGPVAVFILGPVRDLFPGGWLVRLGYAFGHGNRAKGGAHVTDVGTGVVFFRGKLGHFLGRTHISVDVLEAVELVQIGPSAFPVGPVIGHADAVDRAFSLCCGFQGF